MVNFTVITLLCLQFLAVIAVASILVHFICRYETICHIDQYLDSPTFDCNIIYSRLDKYWNNTSGYVRGSYANIGITACSDEVLSMLEEQFNMSLKDKKCEYHCCLTDGTCVNGIGINNQGYHFEAN